MNHRGCMGTENRAIVDEQSSKIIKRISILGSTPFSAISETQTGGLFAYPQPSIIDGLIQLDIPLPAYVYIKKN